MAFELFGLFDFDGELKNYRSVPPAEYTLLGLKKQLGSVRTKLTVTRRTLFGPRRLTVRRRLVASPHVSSREHRLA